MSDGRDSDSRSLWVSTAGLGEESVRLDSVVRVRSTPGGWHSDEPQWVGPRPSYLCWAPLADAAPLLVVAHEVAHGAVSAWRTDKGNLRAVGSPVESGGASPCHVTADPRNRIVYVAHYRGGSVAAIPYGPEGLGRPRAVARFSDATKLGPRQMTAHPHQVVIDGERRQLLVPDLGADLIRRLPLLGAQPSSDWSPLPPIPVHSVAGPRHLVVIGARAYCLNELDSTLSVIDLTAQVDSAELVAVPTSHARRQQGASAVSEPSALRLMPDGTLVSAQRGVDTVTRFRISGDDIVPIQESGTGGEHPRDLVAWDESSIVVANRHSDSVQRLDLDSGDTTSVLTTRRPTCLLEGLS